MHVALSRYQINLQQQFRLYLYKKKNVLPTSSTRTRGSVSPGSSSTGTMSSLLKTLLALSFDTALDITPLSNLTFEILAFDKPFIDDNNDSFTYFIIVIRIVFIIYLWTG